jgi:predicted DNA-binding transcriptional regulator AlpA
MSADALSLRRSPTDALDVLRERPDSGRPASLTAAVAPLLIDRRELARLLSVGVATIDRMRAAGRLPPALALSPGCVRWRLDEIRRWLDAGAPSAAEWAVSEKQNGRSV